MIHFDYHQSASADNEADQTQINRSMFRPKTFVPKTKKYYRRPTPVDLQFKEISKMPKIHFEGNVLCEWNIDGLSKYQILNMINHMLVYSNARYIHNWKQEHIIRAITSSFMGQLNGWWLDYLSELQRDEIKAAIRRDANGEPILSDNGKMQGDQVLELITNIIQHFLSKIQDISEKNKAHLINLKCTP